MKTELLDKAVVDHSGVWPASSRCFFMEEYLSKNVWSAGCSTTVSNHVFTLNEFTQRAKELGFIGKYRWGVEYPTNGKKPDLDDNILIKWESNIGGSSECMAGNLNWFFGEKCNIKSFVIIDMRYKPADTRYLNKPTYTPIKSADDCLVEHLINTIAEEADKHGSISASPMSDSNTFEFPAQDDSDWWDWQNDKMLRLPPACEKVDGFIGSIFSPFKCIFIGIDSEGRIVVEKLDGDLYRYRPNQINLRPLDHATRKAEADKNRVVDSAWGDLRGDMNYSGTIDILRQLYDLGYLRLPPEKN